MDIEEDRELVEKFIKKNGYGFEVLLDLDGLAATHFNVTSHPSKYIIDPEGKIIGMAVGYRPWDSPEAIALLEKLISQIE